MQIWIQEDCDTLWKKQAGAELCQAQVELEDIDEVVVEVRR